MKISSFLDDTTRERIFGWVSYGPDEERAAQVLLQINGEDVARMPASIARPGVADRGLHPTGHCGFEFLWSELPAKFQNQFCVVRVFALNNNGERQEITRSPQTINWSNDPSQDKTRAPSVVVNPPVQTAAKTFVALGVSRGGTSLIAGLLRLMGVFMGKQVANDSHEDPEFHTHDVDVLKQLITQRDAEHAAWGWKYPHSIEYLPAIQDELRNPHFIVIFRDLAAVAQGFNRKHDVPFLEGIDDAYRRYGQLLEFIEQCQGPLLAVSYEKAIAQPALLVRELSEFCGTSLTDRRLAQLIEFVSPGSYKSIKGSELPR